MESQEVRAQERDRPVNRDDRAFTSTALNMVEGSAVALHFSDATFDGHRYQPSISASIERTQDLSEEWWPFLNCAQSRQGNVGSRASGPQRPRRTEASI